VHPRLLAYGCAIALLAIAPREGVAKPSCGQGGASGQGTLSAGSGTAKISVPTSYSAAQAMPLLLTLHGDEGTPDYIYQVFYGQQKSSPTFILVAPKAPFGGGSWYQATSQHVTFINAVISTVLAKYNIDQDRIWITGWSGGATFLGYYAIARQDILAAVVYHMGGGGGGSYSPPAGSCKIPARFVIGSADFLYSLAKTQYTTLTSKGHETVWIELPGVGHNFDSKTLPDTWAWIQKKTLCGTTTPGSCGPGPAPDSGPAPKPDSGPPSKRDSGGGLKPDGGAPPPEGDAGEPSGSDVLLLVRELGPAPGPRVPEEGCSLAPRADRLPPLALVTLIVALALRGRRRRV
jgi:predicted esterase